MIQNNLNHIIIRDTPNAGCGIIADSSNSTTMNNVTMNSVSTNVNLLDVRSLYPSHLNLLNFVNCNTSNDVIQVKGPYNFDTLVMTGCRANVLLNVSIVGPTLGVCDDDEMYDYY